MTTLTNNASAVAADGTRLTTLDNSKDVARKIPLAALATAEGDDAIPGAIGTDDIQDEAVTTAKAAVGLLAASAAGRALMASGLFNGATVLDKFGAGAIPASVMANGAAIAALLSAGLGASATYSKTTSGAQTLLAADASKDRACLIAVVVTEAFADAGGTQPTFTIGETAAATKFAVTGDFAGKAAGTVLLFAGKNLATKNILVTGVAAVGAGTGAIAVTVLALPTT